MNAPVSVPDEGLRAQAVRVLTFHRVVGFTQSTDDATADAVTCHCGKACEAFADGSLIGAHAEHVADELAWAGCLR